MGPCVVDDDPHAGTPRRDRDYEQFERDDRLVVTLFAALVRGGAAVVIGGALDDAAAPTETAGDVSGSRRFPDVEFGEASDKCQHGGHDESDPQHTHVVAGDRAVSVSTVAIATMSALCKGSVRRSAQTAFRRIS